MKALLADLDNTLIDRDAAVRAWITATAPHAADVLLAADEGGRGPRTRLYGAAAKVLGISTEAARLRLKAEVPAFAVLKPDADLLLRALGERGVPVVIVTNGESVMQRAKITTVGLARRVRGILVSEEVGWSKPDPRIFTAALELVRCAPADACMVGDHPVADIQGAGAAGIPAVWVRTRWHQPPPGVRAVDQLTELL